MSSRKGLILVVQTIVLVAVVTIAALLSDASDWQPIALVFVLFALAVASDMLIVEMRGLRVSGAFFSVVLAMVLLGPAPAVALGVATTVVYAAISRRMLMKVLNDAAVWALFPLVGGVMADALGVETAENGAWFCAGVVAVYMTTNVLNFLLVAGYYQAMDGLRLRSTFKSVYVTVLPSEIATAVLTATVAFGYVELGIGAVALAAVVLVVFQYLVWARVQAYERGEELGKRTRELASLQVGLLSTVLQTLSMRDAMTARHSAAVARYSREVAQLMGLSEREQELVHTAALLHDIGKFIFPDSILLADRKLTDEEWETVKLHPEQGAKLVARIEGYGPVADIIHSHHERIDGKGYPSGIAGDEIPLGSRIISVADTYDVMTSRDSYRRPVSIEAAIVELRRVSGTQLDPVVVECFVEMVEAGRIAFRHADEADFERELAFERRVADYARPRAAAA
ncbi:MAG TPA: HD-GYP domain-containing protein [Gaiellaceae bacterium]|nr:HD-GYP domain-containing protein [Gaiellaceae bacterium]